MSEIWWAQTPQSSWINTEQHRLPARDQTVLCCELGKQPRDVLNEELRVRERERTSTETLIHNADKQIKNHYCKSTGLWGVGVSSLPKVSRAKSLRREPSRRYEQTWATSTLPGPFCMQLISHFLKSRCDTHTELVLRSITWCTAHIGSMRSSSFIMQMLDLGSPDGSFSAAERKRWKENHPGGKLGRGCSRGTWWFHVVD